MSINPKVHRELASGDVSGFCNFKASCEQIKDEKNAGKAYVYEMRGKVLNECVEGKFLALIQGGVAFLSSSSSIEKWMARE
ncbi:hypothetical protein P8452_67853 [Trifolium repens]|nr:hypothetical protein P8452_67853 [Trifolium repens]